MKRNSGITLVALVITIIILTIIASIAVYEGKEAIVKSKVQTLSTNMLTIQAQVKLSSEKIESKIWTEKQNKEEKRRIEYQKIGLEQIESDVNRYRISDSGLEIMGLDQLKGEKYIVEFSNEYKNIDVIYSDGIMYKGTRYTKLSELQTALNE